MATAGTDRRILVTGASTGIGEKTVRRLADQGYRVVAAARRRERLEALAQAHSSVEAYPLDITSDEDVAALAEHLSSTGGLDGVVNNAGGALGLDRVEDGDVDGWRWMYELNVLGTLRVTKAMLPLLRAAEGGDIVVVTSTAAYEPYEGGAGYTGVKHAERMLSTTLRQEIVGEPIRIIEVAPGAVATEEFSLTRFSGDAERAKKVYEGYQPLHGEDVAESIEWALGRPEHVNVDLMVVRPRDQASSSKIAKKGA
ncbi:SDR family oxidoreductase [Nesterenkonia sp. NBAIMH1]|uniref:SDR family oxidoreductase n=1 Tax=Nesterenkonia sp. NBAIMH1 TaxID=2600320 RepID=UPI0011B4FC14|nr:SDR family oxidoreductase [Nesterenkonia sp. NBAIMH1]